MNAVTTIGLGRPFLAKPLSPAQRSRSQHQQQTSLAVEGLTSCLELNFSKSGLVSGGAVMAKRSSQVTPLRGSG